MRRSDASSHQRVQGIILGWVRAFRQRQNVYSIVTSAVPGILAVMFLTDLIFGHPHIDRVRVTLWFVMFGVFTLLPLIFGTRYPRAGGIALMVALCFWLWVFVGTTTHAHTEVNALLQVPMLALYVGWFYSSWVARASLAAVMGVVVTAMTSRGWQTDHDFSSGNAVAYAFVVSLFCLEIAMRLRKRAVQQAEVDQLTRVYNRRGLATHATKKIQLARTKGRPVCVAVVDFDDFKTVNDVGGHAAGDAALRATASAWVYGLGENDIVSRIGGDEFALVIEGNEVSASQQMRDICSDSPYSWSWGLAQLKNEESLDELLSRADSAMYRAKARK